MGEKSVIIGAGLAGLSCGCYAQMNGYRSHIFEHHSVPGGVAAWRCTLNHRGAYMGWVPTPEAILTTVPRTLPGLGSFYLAGRGRPPLPLLGPARGPDPLSP